MMKKHFALTAVIIFLLLNNITFSQKFHDSLYYQTFPGNLTIRIYSVKDYTDFTFSSFNKKSDLKYKSNTTTNLGAGVTYKNVSGNFSIGFGFLNNGIYKRGETKSLDFQLHAFPVKWASDFFFLHYKGFHATPEGYASQLPNDYYYRPDVDLNILGLTAYYIQNFRKFSYRSAFYQNEWIKKSSGTLLYGGGVYYENIKSKDSSLIPRKVAAFFSDANFYQFHFISLGPGVGYGYAIVIKKHFFVLGSAIINGNINFSADKSTAKNNKTSFEPGINFKGALGYSGSVWNASLNVAENIFIVKQADVARTNIFPTGEVRLSVAKQIGLKKPIPVVSKVIDKIYGKED